MNFSQINYETHWKSLTCRWIYVLISSPSLFLQAAERKTTFKVSLSWVQIMVPPVLYGRCVPQLLSYITPPGIHVPILFPSHSELGLAVSIPLECGSSSILRLSKQVTKIILWKIWSRRSYAAHKGYELPETTMVWKAFIATCEETTIVTEVGRKGRGEQKGQRDSP